MYRSLVTLVALSFCFANCFAQEQPTLSEKMKAVEFLVGSWKGEGWMLTRQGKSESLSFETVMPKAGGTVLMIDGLGKDKTSGKETHNAFGVLRFDQASQSYKLTSYLSNGQSGDFDVTVGDKTISWEIKGERRIRYTMKIDDQGRWHEIGEINLSGENWTQFLEMTLSRAE